VRLAIAWSACIVAKAISPASVEVHGWGIPLFLAFGLFLSWQDVRDLRRNR